MEYDVTDTSPGLAREHEALAWLRAHDPIHWDAKNEAWLLTRHAHVREVLHQPALWSSARGYFVPQHMRETKLSIITTDDPAHAMQRKLLSRAFTPRMLGRQAARVRDLIDDAIDAVADRRQCDFVESLATPLPMRVIAGLLGFEDADCAEFSRLSDALFEFSNAVPEDPEEIQRGVDAFAALAEHVRRAVADRRRSPREDLLSVLVEGVDAGVLRASEDPDQDDVLQFAVLLVTAGNETTRHTMSFGMHALLEDPRRIASLRAEPGKIPLAVEESIRWASIVRGVRRTALEDTEIGTQKLRRGEQVILLLPSANRDEAVFESPHEFRVARDPNPHLSFSEGNHYCLGANLARLELRIAFERILERLPGLRLAPGAGLVPKLNALTNGVGRLQVDFDSVEPRAAGVAG